MNGERSWRGIAVALVIAAAAAAQDGKAPAPRESRPNPERHDAAGLAPKLTGAKLRTRALDSLRRGLAFLVRTQNEDGSWGSHDPAMAALKDFGFGTASRGSNHGVRIACTAIIAKALLRQPGLTPAQEAAYARAEAALLSTERFAYDSGEAFNTWGYGYKLDFLTELYASKRGKELEDRIKAAAKVCIKGLARYQLVDGGWSYYAPPTLGGTSMSFNTANFAQALHRADRLGIPVPDPLWGDARKILLKMRTPRGSFVYDARFVRNGGSVNELSSAGRTAAAAEALAELGDFGREDLLRSLAIFGEGENWLEDGRKLIRPHSAVHQVSGYFFFYGYHYLSELLVRLGDDVPRERWERNAWTMIRTQEKSGSWWDTPAASYGDKWGTAFALLVLQRYLEAVPPAQAARRGADGDQE